MSLAQKALETKNPVEERWRITETATTSTLLSADAFLVYAQTLLEYCDNSIDENRWVIPFADGIRRASVSFEGLSVTNEELQLIKAYIVDTLSHYSSPSTCASKVKSLGFLFLFLQERGFRVTMLSMPLFRLFRFWLDEIGSLSAVRKNAIENDIYGFVPFLREHGLIRPDPIMPLRSRPMPPGNIRRAPDQYTMWLLDTYFADFSNAVPTAYRCLYLLLRMIPSRDHEALFMMMDGFSVSDDLMEIRFPTHKETPNHRAVCEPHHRYACKYPENLLLRSLQEQKEYAQKCQTSIEEECFKGRLMVSPRNPKRLVTADEFNAFLEDVCEEQGITDAYGKPTKITMYSLRHANGAEIAASPGFNHDEFTRAFAHNSRYSDDCYSYASKHDELHTYAPFTKSVHSALTQPAADSSAAQVVSPMRIGRLQKDPKVQLIGSDSVCHEKGCRPQLIHCIFCNAFLPDTQFIPEAEQCCEILRQRIDACKLARNTEDLAFNEQQLAAYTTFIQRAKSQSRRGREWQEDP